MLIILLKKDLVRVSRNPMPYAIMLALPLFITVLIGAVFGPSDEDTGTSRLPAIHVGLVNETDDLIGGFILGALSQGQLKDMIQPHTLSWEEASTRIRENKLSAVIRIPPEFSEHFLSGKETPPLEFIKNPAESYLPAIVEEIFLVVREVLNAVARNLREELPELKRLLEAEKTPSPLAVAAFTQKAMTKVQGAEAFLFPPLISYQNVAEAKEKSPGSNFNIFAILLPSISALFLLFLAESSIRDLYKEDQLQTLTRFRTMHPSAFPMILSKVVLAMTIVLLASAIMFGGVRLFLNVVWRTPGVLLVLIFSYALFCAGFIALLTALLGSEKKAETLSSVIIMVIGFLGGSMLPPQSLPAFLKKFVSPFFPNYIFSTAVVSTQLNTGTESWGRNAILLLAGGLVSIFLAVKLLNKRLLKGA